MWAEGVKYQGGEELKYEVGEKGLNISPEEVCGTLWGRKRVRYQEVKHKKGKVGWGRKGVKQGN